MTIESKIAKNGTIMYFEVDENIQTEKVKALFNAVKNFDFGSYVNPDMYSLADFVLKLFANIEHAEQQKIELNLEQTARAGFKFASVNEQIWANVMQIAHDRAEDDLSYTHVAITHDLYSIGYNRRAIYHFINFLLTQATDTPDRINYFLKKTGSRYTTQDFIININEEVDTDAEIELVNNTDNSNNEVEVSTDNNDHSGNNRRMSYKEWKKKKIEKERKQILSTQPVKKISKDMSTQPAMTNSKNQIKGLSSEELFKAILQWNIDRLESWPQDDTDDINVNEISTDDKIKAERDELLSTPLTTADAIDAAADAEIELANSNAELDENNVDDSDGNTDVNTDDSNDVNTDFNNEVDTDNNTDNNVNNEVIAESAQASGLTFEECMATIAGLTLSEYLAKQEQEEMAFQAHKLKMKIDALKNGILHREANINGNGVTINDILNNHWKPNTNDGYEEWANELAAEIAHDLNKITTLQAQLAKLIPNPETPQTNWVNPHDFTVTGDLSDRNLNGRIIAQRIARELDLERKEMKADGVQYLLIVKTSQLHPFRFHDFKLATASYKSLDALKKLGGSRINDNDWRVETIDGNLIANGNGVDDFNNFFNHKEEVALTDDFNAKLAALQANANDAKANLAEKQAALDKAQEEFLQADAALEDVNRQIIQLGEDKAKELRDTLFTTELLNAPKMTITAQNGNPHLTKLRTIYISFDCFDHNFFITVDKEASVITFKLAAYDTTEQVTRAVNLLIDAIKRGDKEFTFPTPDELKPQAQESTDKQINDSLIRAVETNLKNIQAHLQAADNNAFNRELELYQICRKALFRKEVTSCTPTKPVSSANSAA